MYGSHSSISCEEKEVLNITDPTVAIDSKGTKRLGTKAKRKNRKDKNRGRGDKKQSA